MRKTCSDFLISRLGEWGVSRIYGYPGDGINGILGALDRASDKVDFIQVAHEEMAAFMACAHAKFTGETGVCLATSGPGAIHLLNGLYDARMDHAPVVAVVGQQGRPALGGSYQREVDLISLFKDVAREYVHMASDASQLRHLVDRAMRIAKAERTVTCIIIPNDLQEEKAVEEPPHEHGTIHSGIGYSSARVVPAAADLRRAADILNAGKRVAMLVGAGTLQASQEVMETAEVLGAGVAKALLGRAALADDLPYVTGSIGLLGTKPSWDLMMGCDTLLMVGSSFPYPEFLPKEGDARGVQIDLDGRMLGIRYPMEVNLATARRRCAPCFPSWSEKAIVRGARRSRKRSLRGGRCWSAGRCWRVPPCSIRSASSGSYRRGCRTIASGIGKADLLQANRLLARLVRPRPSATVDQTNGSRHRKWQAAWHGMILCRRDSELRQIALAGTSGPDRNPPATCHWRRDGTSHTALAEVLRRCCHGRG
jgi:thiamine pyrophosphate-dependent acetolactate synthase large subunit-like protein